MAIFSAFDPTVEVSGRAVLAVVKGMGLFEKRAREILERHNIPGPDPEAWYKQQDWLDAFKEIYSELGPKVLYDIGKMIPETAHWPDSEAETIADGLKTINIAYQMNHRGGYIGSYDYYPIEENKCRMICQTPYPDEFDQGIIATIVNRYKPAGVFMVEVNMDHTLPNKTDGGDLCSFIITW